MSPFRTPQSTNSSCLDYNLSRTYNILSAFYIQKTKSVSWTAISIEGADIKLNLRCSDTFHKLKLDGSFYDIAVVLTSIPVMKEDN